MILRLDPELKRRIDRLARAEGKSTSEVVRGLLEQYVRERDISSHIDDLWGRIGGKLKRRGGRGWRRCVRLQRRAKDD